MLEAKRKEQEAKAAQDIRKRAELIETALGKLRTEVAHLESTLIVPHLYDPKRPVGEAMARRAQQHFAHASFSSSSSSSAPMTTPALGERKHSDKRAEDDSLG